jgi:hypothetical protein
VIVKTALWALQKAIYTRLSTDANVTGLVTGVFDEVLEGTLLPYVQIGDDTVVPYDSKTEIGEDMTLTIHCWSLGPGKTKTKQIMDKVIQSLTAVPLTIDPGFELDGIFREYLEVLQDGDVYHGICRFRVYIKQI